MLDFKRWPTALVRFWHLSKDESLRWRRQNQPEKLRLRREKALAEQELEAQLRKQQAVLEHELASLKAQHNAKLLMLKTKYRQDINDYKQYLKSLDQLKASIQASYTHLPEAVAFTIHHHAKQLLNAMWETQDLQLRMQHEMRLIHFMTAVHEDARMYLEGESTEPLPKKTLALIER